MYLGVSSYSFERMAQAQRLSDLDKCDLAAEIGFEGIEFIDPAPGTDEMKWAGALKARCQALNLRIPAYCVNADFLSREGELERLKRKVDTAAALGAKVLRHDVTWRRDIPWREMIARTAEQIYALSDYASERGVRTCTENHGLILQDADRVEALMLAVSHPNYGWLVDIGNFLCADEWPMHALPIAAPYAVHAHAKDFLWKADCPGEGWIETRGGHSLRGTVVGHGVVPVKACIDALRAAGYDGWLDIEFEGLEETIPALKLGLQFLKQCLG